MPKLYQINKIHTNVRTKVLIDVQWSAIALLRDKWQHKSLEREATYPLSSSSPTQDDRRKSFFSSLCTLAHRALSSIWRNFHELSTIWNVILISEDFLFLHLYHKSSWNFFSALSILVRCMWYWKHKLKDGCKKWRYFIGIFKQHFFFWTEQCSIHLSSFISFELESAHLHVHYCFLKINIT